MWWRILGIGVLGVAVAGPAAAQGWLEPQVPDLHQLVVRAGTEVRITIEGRVARFEVEERFRNEGRMVAEANYLYPLPADAVFTDFSLFFGDQELKGEVLEAEKARAIYEEIVRTQRDPALLTLAGHGLLRARVFPIQRGETRRVILRYTQVLAQDGGAYRLRYALGARGDGPVSITVRAAADRFGIPYSPTHELARSAAEGRVEARVEAAPRGTFELLLPQRAGLAGLSALTHAAGPDERFVLLVLAPPARGAAEALPRDLVFVVDVSGSMSGTKMEQARQALHDGLTSLTPRDRFRIIAFSSGVVEFGQGLEPATPARIAEARGFVDRLTPQGGTDIGAALATAMDRPATVGRVGLVLLLTDGQPTVGERSPEAIAGRAAGAGRWRVFPIGVGHDVNTYLLDRLAAESGGRVEYVAPEADVRVATSRILERLTAPAVTDLRLVESPVRLLETTPSRLPDLYYGEEVVIVARYQGHGTGAVTVEGHRQGRRERFTARVDFPDRAQDNRFLAPLWAARRIGELTRDLALEGQSDAVVRRIRELGQRYGIITAYTAYLVLEPDAPVAAAPAAHVGARAFERAEQSAALRASASLPAEDRLAGGRGAGAGRGVPRRHVEGRLFLQRDSVWTDVGHADTVEVMRVAALSPAWFALVRAVPEFAAWTGVGGDVLVAGRRVSVRVSASGVTTWRPGELERVLRLFRGA
jgi:Ca-activated chloride channel family protein